MSMNNCQASVFLKKHAMFAFAYSHYNPTLRDAVSVVGVLPFRLKDALVSVLSASEIHHVTGVARNGRRFVTSALGLYLIVSDAEYDCLIYDNTDQWYTVDGRADDEPKFMIMYPELVRTLIANQKLPPLGNIQQLIKKCTKQEILEQLKTIEDKKQKDVEASIRYANNKNEFVAYILNLNPTAQPLIDSLFSFDRHYSYSDDVNVWRRGKTREEELCAMISSYGLSPKDVMQRLYKI